MSWWSWLRRRQVPPVQVPAVLVISEQEKQRVEHEQRELIEALPFPAQLEYLRTGRLERR